MNFNYFISEAVFEFILDAVDLVARDGWRLLPRVPVRAGDRAVAPRGRLAEPPLSLHDVAFSGAGVA